MALLQTAGDSDRQVLLQFVSYTVLLLLLAVELNSQACFLNVCFSQTVVSALCILSLSWCFSFSVILTLYYATGLYWYACKSGYLQLPDHYCTHKSESCRHHFLRNYLILVWSSHTCCRQSRLSLPLFCSCSSLIVQKQFLHSAFGLLSLRLSLFHAHAHFLTFIVGQQIHPSYQQISLQQKEVGVEMHVPATDDFITEAKVSHRQTLVQPTNLLQILYRHHMLETCHCIQVTLCPCLPFSRICLRSWIRRISVSTFIK